jgi:hypothetical protein
VKINGYQSGLGASGGDSRFECPPFCAPMCPRCELIGLIRNITKALAAAVDNKRNVSAASYYERNAQALSRFRRAPRCAERQCLEPRQPQAPQLQGEICHALLRCSPRPVSVATAAPLRHLREIQRSRRQTVWIGPPDRAHLSFRSTWRLPALSYRERYWLRPTLLARSSLAPAPSSGLQFPSPSLQPSRSVRPPFPGPHQPPHLPVPSAGFSRAPGNQRELVRSGGPAAFGRGLSGRLRLSKSNRDQYAGQDQPPTQVT